MIKLHLDFETRSKISVTDVGPWRYSLDPSTTVLCLCYRVEYPNGKTISATITKDMFNSWFDEKMLSCIHPEIASIEKIIELAKNEEVRFEAHNSMFEYCMWNNVLARSFGFPPITDFNRWDVRQVRQPLMPFLVLWLNALRRYILAKKKTKQENA